MDHPFKDPEDSPLTPEYHEAAAYRRGYLPKDSDDQASTPQLTPARYIKAARDLSADRNISIADDAEIEYTEDGLGAYVTAQVWVYTDQIDPEPGPTYSVWIAETAHDYAPWEWTWDSDYTCDDDPDGKDARASAHQHARYLRKTNPCAFVAVLPACKAPLPIYVEP